jgi:hypothetical protein
MLAIVIGTLELWKNGRKGKMLHYQYSIIPWILPCECVMTQSPDEVGIVLDSTVTNILHA